MSVPDSPVTLIKDIRPGLRQLTSDFIVLEIYPPTKTKEGKDVATVKVADATGSINIVLYGDYVSALQPSDVLRMTYGYAVVNKGSMCLYMAKHGALTKIGEFCFLFSEIPNMSDPSADFLAEYLLSQQSNGRGNSPPSIDGMPPEPQPVGAQQPRMPGPHFQPSWQQPGPPLFASMPLTDASSRLQPPQFDSGRTIAESPPHSASSPPPSEQSSTGPRVIPPQNAFPPVPTGPSAGPVDPRASRGGQNRYHPYQQPQQQQQRQPLQPIGGGLQAKPMPPAPQSRSNFGSSQPGPRGPPVIPNAMFRQTPSQHPTSVRR